MPCSFINFPSGFLSVSTSVTAIVAGDLRLKMTCETTWGKHRPVTTTSDLTQHLSGYVPSCARRQKWPIRCSQQSLRKLAKSYIVWPKAQANSKPSKSQQNQKNYRSRWDEQLILVAWSTERLLSSSFLAVQSNNLLFHYQASAAKDLIQVEGSTKLISSLLHGSLLASKHFRPQLEADRNKPWESQHIGSPWPTVHNIDRRYNELRPPSHPSLLRWCNWTIRFVNDMV